MADIYDMHSGLITDQLVDTPQLLDPISQQFVDSNDEEYGQWVPPEDEAGDHPDFTPAAPVPAVDNSAESRPLTDNEQANFDALNDILSGNTERQLVAASGRGQYVYRDDTGPGDDDGADQSPPTSSTTPPLLPAKRPPWWQFKWFNWNRRLHRGMAMGAIGLIIILAIPLFSSGSNDTSSTSTTTTTPPYTVPTITETSAPPTAAPGTPGADGPIGIKSVETRCTAGSTNPEQAFDHNDDTAWMCVPASGVPGTVMRVQFDGWYLVTGMSIVPGWNRINPDNSDEWIKHMTAAVVEYQFNDPDETRLTQDTQNYRGPVPTPVNPPVLASAMTITIREFGKPTGAVPNTTTIPGKGATIASDTPVTGDLRDFAISTIDVIGHRPN